MPIVRTGQLVSLVSSGTINAAGTSIRGEPIIEDLPSAETLIKQIEAEVAPVRFVAVGNRAKSWSNAEHDEASPATTVLRETGRPITLAHVMDGLLELMKSMGRLL
jgi:hypothetical protein